MLLERTYRQKMQFFKNSTKAKLIEEFPTDAALEAYNQQYYDLCRRENIKDFLIHLASNVKLKVKVLSKILRHEDLGLKISRPGVASFSWRPWRG